MTYAIGHCSLATILIGEVCFELHQVLQALACQFKDAKSFAEKEPLAMIVSKSSLKRVLNGFHAEFGRSTRP
jgi:hypothetical protein